MSRLTLTAPNHEKPQNKKVATFVTTSFRERKTGLKPATPSLEG